MSKGDLKSFISQPYPFYYEGRQLAQIVSFVFLMTLGFNYLFEPFDVYVPEHKMDFFWISVVHAAVSAVIISTYFLIIGLIPNVDLRWKVKQEIVALFILLVLIGLGQFLIRDVIYDNPNNWSIRYLVEEIRNTLLVGSLFIAIFLPFNFRRLNDKNSRGASLLESKNVTNENSDSTEKIFIQTQIKGDDFEMDIASFIYAEAEKNYVQIYLKNQSGSEKLLKRITLKDLEQKLNDFPHFMKVHRSFLINVGQVEKVIGNAQGYKLKLKDHPNQVPVSRSMIAEFERKMNEL